MTQKSSQMLFVKHAHRFTSDQLKELRSKAKRQRQDGPFISKCLDILYGRNTARIAEKYPGERKLKEKR